MSFRSTLFKEIMTEFESAINKEATNEANALSTIRIVSEAADKWDYDDNTRKEIAELLQMLNNYAYPEKKPKRKFKEITPID